MRKKTITGLIFASIVLAGCNADTTNNSNQVETNSNFMAAVNTPDPIRGASLFATNCAVCHGQGGMGSEHGPALINRIYEPSHHDDASFYRAITNGSPQHHWQFGDMPPVAGVRVEDIGHIIAYVRQQQRLAGIE